MTVNFFVQHTLDHAAGVPVDGGAFQRAGIDLAKLRSLGKAYRQGWLTNVMARITPMTARSLDDYVLMADLFTGSAYEADMLLQTFAADMARFAITAGVYFSPLHTPPQMASHVRLWQQVAELLTAKFDIEAPALGRTTLAYTPRMDADMAFVRAMVQQRMVA